MRTIVIGDIHGCSDALKDLLTKIDPKPEDTIITLGDYIDRGPNSKEVIDILLDLNDQCNYIPLMGNHELMLVHIFDGDSADSWMYHGGLNTILSYKPTQAQTYEVSDLKVLREVLTWRHVNFIKNCRRYYEDEKNIFVHANYDPQKSMDEQSERDVFWKHIDARSPPGPHQSGKTVWVGHTPQASGMILDLGHLLCIDTFSFRTGIVTGVEVNTREAWRGYQEL